jgi:flagellar biosynthesis/type III secretory pathway protein FliH
MNPTRTLFPPGGNPVKVLEGRLSTKELPARDGAWLKALHEDELPPPPPPIPEPVVDEAAEELERLRETEARLDAAHHQYVEGIAKLQQVLHTLPATQADDTVELAFVIARAIVGRELDVDRARAASLVAETIKMLDAPQGATVRMNPEDLEYLREHRADLFSSPHLTFTGDPNLDKGGCIVDTPKRIIDASLDTRLGAVRERLVKMLKEDVGVTS